MKDIFISYKAEEKDEAVWVKSVLESNGFSCWMAPADIPGGSSYAAEIPQAIRRCKIFVLVLSAQAQSSPWVSREVDLALNERKIVMPFMLENCALRDDFNFYLTNVQRYTAYENKAAAMEKMVREIRALLGVREELQTAEKPAPETPVSEEPAAPAEAAPEPIVVPTEVEAVPEVQIPAFALPQFSAPGGISSEIANEPHDEDASKTWYRPDDIGTPQKEELAVAPKDTSNLSASKKRKVDVLCLLSLCFGGLAMVSLGYIVLPNIAAIVLAFLGIRRIGKKHTYGKVMAIIGFFLGIIAMFIILCIWLSVLGAIIALHIDAVAIIFFILQLKKAKKKAKLAK